MKKFLLMLAMMLPCLGAWAEVAQPETGVYVISGDNPAGKRGKLAAVEGITDHPALSEITWDSYDHNSATPITNGEHWFVYKIGEKYVIYNLGLNKYLYNPKNGNQINFSDSPYLWEILVNSNNNNFNSIYDATGTYLCFACSKNAANRNVHFNNQVGDGGSLHTFTAVENGEATYATKIAEIKAALEEREITYTLTDPNGVTYTGSYTGKPQLDYPEFTGVKTISNCVWNGASFTADITFPFPTSKVGGATNWTYIKTRPISSYEAYFYVNNDYVKFKTQKNTNLSYLPSPDVSEIAKYLWAIYPNFDSETGKFTFNIKNSASNKYLPAVSGAANSIQLLETAGDFSWNIANNGYYGFCIPNTNIFLNAGTSNTNEQAATFWAKNNNPNHEGVNLVFCDPIYKATCNITDNSGNEYSWLTTINYTSDENDVERPVITGIFDSWITNTQWSEGTCNISLTFPFTPSSATTSNPIQIANWGANDDANKKRWHAVLEDGVYNVKAQTAVPNINEWDTWLWEIHPQFNNGAFTYHIKNAHTGTYVYVDPTKENAQGAKGYVTLSETPTTFNVVANGNYINWGYTGNNKTLKLTTNGSGDTDVYLGSYNGTHAGNHIAFPALTKFKLTVGPTGYASLYTPVAGTFAGEVKTYAVTKDGIVNGYANLTELIGVAANQGAIVEAAPGTYTFTAGSISSNWSNNLLTGTSVNTMVEGDAYVLGNVDGVGLYKALSTDGSFLNNAGKAYLPASAVSTTAQALRFNFGGNTTAIESVLNNGADANAPIYDLTGRCVVNVVKGGIYIQNGKKFIVK